MSAGTAFVARPDNIAYCNELVGGPHHGQEYLIDSNFGRGQRGKLLMKWMENNGVRRVYLDYFWMRADRVPAHPERAYPGAAGPRTARWLSGCFRDVVDAAGVRLASRHSRAPDARVGTVLLVYSLSTPTNRPGQWVPPIKSSCPRTAARLIFLPHEPEQCSRDDQFMKRVLAAILLMLALVQISLFFVGLQTPLRRFVLLGKSRQERLAIAWGTGLALEGLAAQFPIDARIYLIEPEEFLDRQTQYYFLPRRISATMHNTGWSADFYKNWNERPTVGWLLQHGFTHVLKLSTTNGVAAWNVSPSMKVPPGILQDQ